jgi:hypothetical protein
MTEVPKSTSNLSTLNFQKEIHKDETKEETPHIAFLGCALEWN